MAEQQGAQAPQGPPSPVNRGTDDAANITIEVSFEVDLSPDEVWSDKDWPTGWTAKDVVELFKKQTAERFIKDWDLLTFGADVTVHARGEYVRVTLR